MMTWYFLLGGLARMAMAPTFFDNLFSWVFLPTRPYSAKQVQLWPPCHYGYTPVGPAGLDGLGGYLTLWLTDLIAIFLSLPSFSSGTFYSSWLWWSRSLYVILALLNNYVTKFIHGYSTCLIPCFSLVQMAVLPRH